MRRDVGARVERITSSEYSGSTSAVSPDEYASTFDRLLLLENKGGEKKKEGGEEQQDSDNNKSRESSSRRQAASETARTIAKCIDELLSSTSSRLHKRSQEQKRASSGRLQSKPCRRISKWLAENRNTLNGRRTLEVDGVERSKRAVDDNLYTYYIFDFVRVLIEYYSPFVSFLFFCFLVFLLSGQKLNCPD